MRRSDDPEDDPADKPRDIVVIGRRYGKQREQQEFASQLAVRTRMSNGDPVPDNLRQVLLDAMRRRLDVGDETDSLR